MMIEHSGKSYLVIGHLEHDEEKDRYLCEDSANHENCQVIAIRDQKLMSQTVEFLYKQAENSAFTDFKECFVDQESLHLVFSCPKGIRIQEKLNREYVSLLERLEIGGRLLEKLVLLSMPCYFQCQCLKPEHIYVGRSLDVSFSYRVDALERCKSFTMRDVQKELSKLLFLLFEEELKKEVIPPIRRFREDLEQRTGESDLEWYQQYQACCGQVKALSKEELKIPKTWIFRMWDRVRKLFKPLKRLAAAAVLTAVLVYMIWNIKAVSEPSEPAAVMEQIGTLTIR